MVNMLIYRQITRRLINWVHKFGSRLNNGNRYEK